MRNLPLLDCTRRIGPPEGWDHERDGICHTIEVCDRDGYMITGWELSPSEIDRLQRGQALFLLIRGSVHPVVALMVGDGP